MSTVSVVQLARQIQAQSKRRPILRVGWIVTMLTVILILLPLLIFFGSQPEFIGSSLLAYVNCLLVGLAAIRFIKQRTVEGLIPILYLVWFTLGWPVGSIVFAIISPEIKTETLRGPRLLLDGNLRLQTVTLVFLAIYLTVTSLLIRKKVRTPQVVMPKTKARRLSAIVLLISMTGLLMNAYSKVSPLPGFLQYVADGGYIYVCALPAVIGALFGYASRQTQITTLVLLFGLAGFYTIGNARGMALLPLTLFFAGFLLLSTIKPRTKSMTLIALAIGLPTFLVVSDTTRQLMGNIGFSDIGRRIEAMGRWHEAVGRVDVLEGAFGRLFSTGGQTIITLSPEVYDYLDFTLPGYVIELFARLLPGRYYYQPYYSTTYRLKDYGIFIAKTSSVELSTLGAFWFLGGWPPLIIGSFLLALLHVGVALWLGRAFTLAPQLGLFYFGMLAYAILWGQNLDFISHFRAIVWSAGVGVVLYYFVIRPIVGESRPEFETRGVRDNEERAPVQLPPGLMPARTTRNSE